MAQIFQDLSVLVVEQGTILDRIDYNVQETKEHMVAANKELKTTVEYETSARAQGCIRCQVTCIVVLVFLLILKFALS